MTSSPWGAGDLFAISTGITVLLTGVILNPDRRDIQSSTALLATGISLGPLLLIIADPFYQYVGFPNRLLDVVLNEGRATLWWAASVAALYLIRDIFAGES